MEYAKLYKCMYMDEEIEWEWVIEELSEERYG